MNTAHEDILSPGASKTKAKSYIIGTNSTNNDSILGKTNPTQKLKSKMAAVFPDYSFEGTSNEIDYNSQKNSTHQKHGLNTQIELSDIKVEDSIGAGSACNNHRNGKDSYDSNYPLQLRAPVDNQLYSSDHSQTTNVSNTRKSSTNSHNESLEMASFGLDGSMLLYDTDEDDISMPGSSTDSPCRKRPRNATSSSVSDSSSISDEHRNERTSKGPFKRIFQSLTPKKATEHNSSGIWFDSDPTVPDLSLQGSMGQRSEWESGRDEPECPFCDLRGLDPDTMKEHVETAHSNLLGPNQDQPNRTEKKVAEPKPTLLSLSQSAKKVESVILCPICGLGNYDPDFITAHMDSEHPEMGTNKQSRVTNGMGSAAEAAMGTSDAACPVCGVKGLSQSDLATHVEGHFEDTSHKSRGVCNGDDNQLAWQLAEEEKQLQERREKEEFKRLQVCNLW